MGAVAPADPRLAYRTRAKVRVGPRGEIGLFGVVGDHEVVDNPGCAVVSPAIAGVLAELRRLVATRAGELAHPAGDGGLVALDLREVHADGVSRVLVTFVASRSVRFRLEVLRGLATELRAAAPDVAGVAVNFQDGATQVLGAETLVLTGARSLPDTVGGSRHRATFGSFVQAHRGQAARMHAAVAEAVFARGDRPRVLDLYGGSGAIALGLAARGADVLLVESFGPAVAQASAAAREAGVPLRVECADVAAALVAIARRGERVDVAIVNPPRRGLDAVVRERLAALSPSAIVYVSCHPETLARDLAHLAALGFGTDALAPLDMIPQTDEVETVAVLSARAPLAPVVLYEDAEVVVVDKPPHESTTPQGEREGESLLARVRRLAGASGAVAVHRLDKGTSGVVMFARDPARAGAWAAALGSDEARKEYLAAVRGVPEAEGTLDAPLVIDGRAKAATTRFVLQRTLARHALVEVVPEEGRTHQIRRHLADAGHPVLGDERYGHASTNRHCFERHGLDRTFLHARSLTLIHPGTGRRLTVDAALPGDLAAVLWSFESVRSRTEEA